MPQRFPWVTVVLAMIAAVVGHDIVYLAFFSVEQLSRNIARPLFFMALAAAVVVALIEVVIRVLIRRGR